MLTEGQLGYTDGVGEDALMRDYVAGSASRLASRREEFAEIDAELAREQRLQGAALERSRAAQARAVRRQVRRESRASMTAAQRLGDSLQELRRHAALCALIVLALGAATLIATGPKGMVTIGECAALLLVLCVVAYHVREHHRESRLPDGYEDRVSDQLSRVKAASSSARGELAPR